ncbi:hypothetical protein Pla52o_58140 [Novipirellula galeiformis]|uniref:Uncharacterized protein n=1 Tax=Novipirellula galeiformis TaxID=2528004 RepID=A0A5C6BCG9_9BACT|nr:hypothetical protein Pla52o_58140 [Novipirellula galeiformis]
MNVNHHPLGINVTDLQVASFLEPQAHRVGRPKEGCDPLDSASVDDAVHLFDGKHLRHRFGPLQLHCGERLPVPLAGSRVEELDARECYTDRPVRELFFVFEVQEVSSQFGFGDPVGAFFAVVGQLSHGSQVAVHGAFAHACELQVVVHVLIELAVEVTRCSGKVIVVNHGRSLLRE